MLTATLPLLGVLIGAGLQYLFGRTLEGRKQIQSQKAQAYADFFKAVAAIAKFDQTKDNLSQLADAKTRICVYGSKEVIAALGEFERSGARLDNPDSKKLIIRVLGHMRRDVGVSVRAPSVSDLSWIIFGPTKS